MFGLFFPFDADNRLQSMSFGESYLFQFDLFYF